MLWVTSFLDELEKIGVQLSADEHRGQSAKFTALGAAAMPVISGTKNLIESGRVIPKGANKGRWLAANMASGALLSGIMPIIRGGIERRTQEKARTRQQAEREARLGQ